MRRIYSIFDSVENESSDNLIFELSDFVKNEDLPKYRLDPKIPLTSGYFGTGKYKTDVKIGREFDIIFGRESPNEFLNTKAILKYVNVNPSL